MNNTLKNRTELFVRNRDIFKSNFRWDNSMLFPLCASLYTEKELIVDPYKVRAAKDLIKRNTGFFSNFRASIQLVYATKLSLDDNPELKMKNALLAYGVLKKEFRSSLHLPLSAFVLADMVEAYDYDRVVIKAKQIYSRMKKEHPFLTSSEDCGFAVMFAISDLSVDKAIEEMESCYRLLKGNFFSSNAVQSLSHALAIGEEDPITKCKRVMSIFNEIKAKGYKFGTGNELAILGVLALETEDVYQVVKSIIEVNEDLLNRKGFGAFGTGRYQRMMYAAILVMQEYMKYREDDLMNITSINSVTSIIIAQQVAVSAAVAASAASAASSS